MSYKQILVQTGPGARDVPRLDLAASLARRNRAFLTGVYVSPPSVWRSFAPGPESAAPVAQLALADLEARQDAAAGQEMLTASEALRIAGRPHELEPTVVQIADNLAAFAALARAADLTVLPAPDDATAAVSAAPDQVALAAGGPVLIVSEAWTPGPVGERVLIAWNGSAESARAVKDALPILKQAEHIDVLMIDHDPAAAHAETTVPAYLRKHGCSASALRVSSIDQPIGEVLLREAHRLEADMIVMGLYGHSRLREVVLGGASRHLLAHARVPMFVSH